jgi:hypothetical protein
VTGPAGTAALIDQVRADGVVLTYDPQDRTLRAGGHNTLSVTIGKEPLTTGPGKGGPPSEKKEREHPPRPEAEPG